MVYPKLSQAQTEITKRINVTTLTQKQRRQLFRNCMSQDGFIGFIKKQQDSQTQYVFCYLHPEQNKFMRAIKSQ